MNGLQLSPEQPKDIDVFSSYAINWPALYAVTVLMLAGIGGGLWVGAYESVVSSAGMLAVGGCFGYAGVLEQWGDDRHVWWRRAGFVAAGLVVVWSALRLVRAWLTHGG